MSTAEGQTDSAAKQVSYAWVKGVAVAVMALTVKCQFLLLRIRNVLVLSARNELCLEHVKTCLRVWYSPSEYSNSH
jgi:hypothetical protein